MGGAGSGLVQIGQRTGSHHVVAAGNFGRGGSLVGMDGGNADGGWLGRAGRAHHLQHPQLLVYLNQLTPNLGIKCKSWLISGHLLVSVLNVLL